MRILITGSRDWTDVETIRHVLDTITQEWARTYGSVDLTLVSGACPTGADAMAEYIGDVYGWTIERHPADWDTHGKRAGYVRNAHMVSLGADVCLAFILNHSKGATMCSSLAIKAGIPTTIHEVND